MVVVNDMEAERVKGKKGPSGIVQELTAKRVKAAKAAKSAAMEAPAAAAATAGAAGGPPVL